MNERRWIVLCLLVLVSVGAYLYVEVVQRPPEIVAPPPVVDVPVLPPETGVVETPTPAPTTPAANPSLVLAPRVHFDRSGLLWEQAIQRILALQATDSEKAQMLFSLLRNVPEEAYATVTEQAVEWLRDPDYAAVALPLIVNPETHGAVESVLFSDLMERPDAITLPTLLLIARTPTHPFAQSARDNLNLLLGKDFESDWGAWESAVQQKLAAEK